MELKIEGMHCKGCELGLEERLEELDFIKTVKADFKKGSAKIEYEESKLDMDQVEKVINELGFKLIK
ncbi:MAG: heavy-metal-associated domain-containing protein [Clostridia bacterium]|nr:heavy-metal-associated domain-containing protein [Clostridia bacterium]